FANDRLILRDYCGLRKLDSRGRPRVFSEPGLEGFEVLALQNDGLAQEGKEQNRLWGIALECSIARLFIFVLEYLIPDELSEGIREYCCTAESNRHTGDGTWLISHRRPLSPSVFSIKAFVAHANRYLFNLSCRAPTISSARDSPQG